MTPAILCHGGAGNVAADRHDRLRGGVRTAAAVGHSILAAGGSALDAVVATVRILEDDPEFNAGLGSALTRDGTVETDAAVMDGATQRIGAVAAVPDLGQAIALARAVLDAKEHVLLAGPAALRFALEHGIVPTAPGALITERARAKLASPASSGGTVGAVARDRDGRFAAATSTGGISGKRSGRVGDSPIPGAGTWADSECAVSATGDGEAILRVALAHTIALRHGMSLQIRRDVDRLAAERHEAERIIGSALAANTRHALAELARITGGSAGVIAIDATSHVALRLSSTMPVAWIDAAGAGDSLGDAA